MSGAKRPRGDEGDDGKDAAGLSAALTAFLAGTALQHVALGDETFLVRHIAMEELGSALSAPHWPTITVPGYEAPLKALCVLFDSARVLQVSATESGDEVLCFRSDALPEATHMQLLGEIAGPATIEELFSANAEETLAGGFTAAVAPDLADVAKLLEGAEEAE